MATPEFQQAVRSAFPFIAQQLDFDITTNSAEWLKIFGLPVVEDFPTPGATRGWEHADWADWLSLRGFGSRRTASGISWSHPLFRRAVMALPLSKSDHRNWMNNASLFRTAWAAATEDFAQRCCQVIKAALETPDSLVLQDLKRAKTLQALKLALVPRLLSQPSADSADQESEEPVAAADLAKVNTLMAQLNIKFNMSKGTIAQRAKIAELIPVHRFIDGLALNAALQRDPGLCGAVAQRLQQVLDDLAAQADAHIKRVQDVRDAQQGAEIKTTEPKEGSDVKPSTPESKLMSPEEQLKGFQQAALAIGNAAEERLNATINALQAARATLQQQTRALSGVHLSDGLVGRDRFDALQQAHQALENEHDKLRQELAQCQGKVQEDQRALEQLMLEQGNSGSQLVEELRPIIDRIAAGSFLEIADGIKTLQTIFNTRYPKKGPNGG